MKKLLLSICLVMFCLIQINAQEPQFVSTEKQNRNVLIEELTGRGCTWCPLGQQHVNQAIKEFPGRVFTSNIHSDGGTAAGGSPPGQGTGAQSPEVSAQKGTKQEAAPRSGGSLTKEEHYV